MSPSTTSVRSERSPLLWVYLKTSYSSVTGPVFHVPVFLVVHLFVSTHSFVQFRSLEDNTVSFSTLYTPFLLPTHLFNLRIVLLGTSGRSFMYVLGLTLPSMSFKFSVPHWSRWERPPIYLRPDLFLSDVRSLTALTYETDLCPYSIP